MKDKKIIVSGKRKTSVARATITEGKGKISINNTISEKLPLLRKLMIEEPIRIAANHGDINFDIKVDIKGGGSESQIEAARLAIARAILAFTKSEVIKRDFLNYDRNMLIADTRKKETCKPGDSKARAMRQSSKR